MIYIIGCGGVGSWLCPSMCRLARDPKLVTVVDGDVLEPKNLDRQLYDDTQLGLNKAGALCGLYGCNSVADWYSYGSIEHRMDDWLMVCVDNHAARLAAIRACDTYDCRAIIAANETTSAEAYFYQSSWNGTKFDPRVFYPDLLTDHSNDPTARGMGCTGEAQQENRQLVSANFMAAALAQHLYVMWALEAPQMDKLYWKFLAHKLNANMSKLESHRAIIE